MDALIQTATALTAPGKGILASDESTGTIGKRFAKEGLENVEVALTQKHWELSAFAPFCEDASTGD